MHLTCSFYIGGTRRGKWSDEADRSEAVPALEVLTGCCKPRDREEGVWEIAETVEDFDVAA